MASGLDDVLFPFFRNLRQMPLYVIHGAKDQIMPVWLSRNIAVVTNGAISFEGTITP